MSANMGALLNVGFTRKAVRSPENPSDKSTLVSLYPKPVPYKSSTVQPGEYILPAGSEKNPSVLIIGSSSWYKDLGPTEPLIEVPVNSMIMAESVIKDYCQGLFGCSSTAGPAIFFVPGCKYGPDRKPHEELTKKWIQEDYKSLIESALTRQKNWFEWLIQEADVDWARTNGNPNSVNNLQRLACELLGRKDKAWMQDFKAAELKPCVACGNLVNYNYPVCQHCGHVINPEKYKELKLQKVS